MDKDFDFKSVRPVGERISTKLEMDPLQSMKNIAKIADAIVPSGRHRGMYDMSEAEMETHLRGTRRSAQIHEKDIRDPFIIQMILEDYEGMKRRFNYVVPLTQEFIDTYLQESENDIKARGTPDEAKGTIPLWQPMLMGGPVGKKVSAKLLYVKMGGTLCDEVRCGPMSKPFQFKKPNEG